MSSVDYSDYQRAVRLMEDAEARRHSKRVKAIRSTVAREIGVSPGTLENIRKGRLKGLHGRVERAIDAALLRFLKRQEESISHELAIAAARLERGNSRLVAKATAARDALATLIDEAQASLEE